MNQGSDRLKSGVFPNRKFRFQIFCQTTATRAIYAKRAEVCEQWSPSAVGQIPPRLVDEELTFFLYSSNRCNLLCSDPVVFLILLLMNTSSGHTKPGVPYRVYRCEWENQVGCPGWGHPTPLQGKQTVGHRFRRLFRHIKGFFLHCRHFNLSSQ